MWSYACCEIGSRTVVVPSRSSCMRKEAHSGGTPSLVQAIWRAGLLMLSNARRMSQYGVFEGVHQEEGGTVCAMFGTEAMLRRVQHVVGLPGSAYAVCKDAGP